MGSLLIIFVTLRFCYALYKKRGKYFMSPGNKSQGCSADQILQLKQQTWLRKLAELINSGVHISYIGFTILQIYCHASKYVACINLMINNTILQPTGSLKKVFREAKIKV